MRAFLVLAAAASLFGTACLSGHDDKPTTSGAQGAGTAERVARAVTAEGLQAHLEALQRIADRNEGTRASGTPGYDASAAYVAEQLRQAGYTPSLERVRYTDAHELAPPELVLCFDPLERGREMVQLVGTKATRYVAQPPKGDLGQRMHAAARELAKWYGRLLIVGVDAPDVPAGHIARVEELLRDHELVLGPRTDGGFWCVGMQDHVEPARQRVAHDREMRGHLVGKHDGRGWQRR